MADRTADRITQDLRDLRNAVIAGQYDSLAKKTEQLEKLMARLPDASLSETGLAAIKKEAIRTEGVIHAAKEGIAEATTRLDGIRNGVQVQTYSAGGTRSDLPATKKSDHSRRV